MDGHCYLCGVTKKLCKAHIINRSAIKRLFSSPLNNRVLLIKPSKKTHSSVPDCLYDENILCSNCDGIFAADEDYLMSFINQDFKRINLSQDSLEKKDIYLLKKYKNFKSQSFKKALLFILWKASISKHQTNLSFSLGEHEHAIKKLITNSIIPDESYPYVIYSLKQVDNALAYGIRPPFNTKLEGIDMACFLILDYVFLFFLTNEPYTKFYLEKISANNLMFIQEPTHQHGEELLMQILNLKKTIKYKRTVS